MALAGAGSAALCKCGGYGERGDRSRNGGCDDFERLHGTNPLAIIVVMPQVRQDIGLRDRRTNPVSLTDGFDQPRRLGGSGSGVRSLPRRTVVVVQKVSIAPVSRAVSVGASLRTAMGTTQPMAAMQARVMPLQGFCPGCCWRATISMQSSDMPESDIADIVIGADTAD